MPLGNLRVAAVKHSRMPEIALEKKKKILLALLPLPGDKDEIINQTSLPL